MTHLDALDGRFGASRVLGGQCVIATTLTADGTIREVTGDFTLIARVAHGYDKDVDGGGKYTTSVSAGFAAVGGAKAGLRFVAGCSKRGDGW